MLGRHHSIKTRQSIRKAQKGRRHTKQEGFQKGHKAFAGTEKTRFKKGQISWHKGRKGKEASNYKHGMNGTSFYSRWRAINQRCTNSRHKQYKDYGGRGIINEWRTFEEFKRDMYDSFLEHLAVHGERQTRIERIDNDGNYNKQNCKWSTCKEQMRNRRNNHMITANGKTQCMTDWAKEIGISYPALWKRLKKMSPEEAVGYEI
jgi:hypothetical protein